MLLIIFVLLVLLHNIWHCFICYFSAVSRHFWSISWHLWLFLVWYLLYFFFFFFFLPFHIISFHVILIPSHLQACISGPFLGVPIISIIRFIVLNSSQTIVHCFTFCNFHSCLFPDVSVQFSWYHSLFVVISIVLNSFLAIQHHFYSVSWYFLIINMFVCLVFLSFSLIRFKYLLYSVFFMLCVLLSPFIGKVCYFTIHFIVNCYANVFGLSVYSLFLSHCCTVC